MSLPSTDDLRAYLRIQTNAEDSVLSGLLAAAQSAVTGWLGKPIKSEKRTFIIYSQRSPSAPLTIATPLSPIGTIYSIVDGSGSTVAQSDLFIDSRVGMLVYKSGARWMNGPYTIVCEVGLECYEEYLTSIEPAIAQAITDVASDLYQRRNPAAAVEKEGGGIETAYSDQTRGVGSDNRREDLITPRIAAMLATWRTIGT